MSSWHIEYVVNLKYDMANPRMMQYVTYENEFVTRWICGKPKMCKYGTPPYDVTYERESCMQYALLKWVRDTFNMWLIKMSSWHIQYVTYENEFVAHSICDL